MVLALAAIMPLRAGAEEGATGQPRNVRSGDPGVDSESVKRPYVEVGDCWTFRSENLNYRGRIERFEECVTFVDYDKDAILVVDKIQDGRELDLSYSTSWDPHNGVTGMTSKSGFRLLRFPLRIGDSYVTESDISVPQSGFSSQVTLNVKVVGWEDVTVPAGTFRAIRVEANGTQVRLDRPGTASVKIKTWYSPVANRRIKYDYESGSTNFVNELSSYRLNP
jgi:hypothetical protein